MAAVSGFREGWLPGTGRGVLITPDILQEIGKIGIILRSVGGIAQLGERLHGMQEVIGSIPFTSTNRICSKSPSSRGLGHRPFTAITRVRISVGTPDNRKAAREGGFFVSRSLAADQAILVPG